MVTFSVGLAYPSPKELFRQMPSSKGELTVQLETRTFLQQSISNPSLSVSTFILSIVRLSTPVARMAKCPPCRTETSRILTLRQSFRLMVLFPPPSGTLVLRVSPLPQIRPCPRIEIS